ncbi:hypothetical protein M569_11927, partial [Genlisea aurea]
KGGNQKLNFPAGFRFHPTDEELVVDYLLRKSSGQQRPAEVIAEIDLYKFDPWDLPEKSYYGEKEWYFFSPRDRKYPNGCRPNRAAGNGYWKATGADKPVGKPKTLAIKKALVFYAGKAPKGVKTNWIMHEYRLANVDRSATKNNKLRLDDWVLCRIYNKKGTMEKHYVADHDDSHISDGEEERKPTVVIPPTTLQMQAIRSNDCCPYTSESNPSSHNASSSSENTSSPDFESEEDKLLDFDFPMDEGFQD